MLQTEDTIVAIASPLAPAARGIVRLSGDEAIKIVDAITSPADVIRPRRQTRQVLCGSPIGTVQADVLLWPTASSYTGQMAAEIHVVGSLPVLESIVDAVVAAGGRPAGPGEFTLRAFLAGRLDLTQAEAVLGVIDAQGRGALDHALQQLAGNLSRPLETMRSDLLDLLADVEAGLDFVDEDLEFISSQDLQTRLGRIARQLRLSAATVIKRGGQTVRALQNAYQK